MSLKLVWDTDRDGLYKDNPHQFEEYVDESDPKHVIVVQQGNGGFWYAFEIKGKSVWTIESGRTKDEVRRKLIEERGYKLKR